MAATNFKPEFTVCKTESDAFTGMIENREPGAQKQRPPTSRQPGSTRPPSIPALRRLRTVPPAANCMHA